MSNDSRKNLQGTDGQNVADLTTAAAAVNAAVEGATASSTTGAQDEAILTDAQQPQNSPYTHSPQSAAQATQHPPQPSAPRPTQSKVMVAPVPAHMPATEPRPWYRSRRSFAAKGGGGKVLVAGLGLTYTDHATGAVLLTNVDMGFRARTLSAILDPTGRRARARWH